LITAELWLVPRRRSR